MRPDEDRLRDILSAIDRILARTAAGHAAFENDEMLQVWVLHHLEIVGEAARGLSQEFRERHPDKTWSKAVGLRNILVHHYFDINLKEIWRVVELDLPLLRRTVCRVLESGYPSAP